MSYRNSITVFFSFILIFSSKQGVCKDICRMDYGKALEEPRNAKLVRNKTCAQHMIRDAHTKSEIYCLEACYKIQECHSVYYDRETGYCILYRHGNFWNVCFKFSYSSHAFHAIFNRMAFREMVSKITYLDYFSNL